MKRRTRIRISRKIPIALGGLIFFGIACTIGIYVFILARNLPDIALLSQNRIAQSTKIYDRAETILLYELYGEEKRTVIPFNQIPDLVKHATIAVEDRNFYFHTAIDWKSLARAIIVNITRIGVVQGGSTITQQLAKNAFLTPDRTITRKIKEVLLSYRLEKKYSKDEILGLYLNQIPYGANAYGIEAAAKTYFNKNAKDLLLPEVALLVSLPKAPSYYSPWGAQVKELLTRKDQTLEQMRFMGFITEEEENTAKKISLSFTPQISTITAPHFSMLVQEYLIQAYGEDFVRTGGLRVITTLDGNLQKTAEKAIAEGAKRNEELYKGKNAALVAQDPKTGQILALVGSRDYFDESIDGNFNVATQGLRQPGSAIKPFAYSAVFAKGFSPDTVLFDVETEFDTTGDPERSYKPVNFDEKFRGPITMRNALAQSINIPAIKTLYLAGENAVIALAHAAGITTLNEKNRYGLSLALGGGEVKLIDMVGAYATLSQDGIRHAQVFILKITDGKGNTLEKYIDRKERVIAEQPVRIVNDILSDVNARAPLFGASSNLTTFPNQEVAIKTGTTNDYRDAWTFGYTPALVVGVWAGNSDNRPMERHGGSILAAVPIWSAFMKEALKEKPFEPFPRPEPVTTDKPAIDGAYIINGEIHSILYYVNKKDPLGPPPQNPTNDAQFAGWEHGIIEWLQKNPEFLKNLPVMSLTPNQSTTIDIQSPKNGDFVTPLFIIAVSATSTENIIRMEIYLNGLLINQTPITPTRHHQYQISITASLDTQNKLTIRAITEKNAHIEKEIIIFKK